MKLVISLFCFILWGQRLQAQVHHKIVENPISIADPAFLTSHSIQHVFIDSIRYTKPPDIPADSIGNMLFFVAENGERSLYVETCSFIINRYWKLFSSRSAAFRKAVPTPATFTQFTYYVNKQELDTEVIFKLSRIIPRDLKAVSVDNKHVKLRVKNYPL